MGFETLQLKKLVYKITFITKVFQTAHNLFYSYLGNLFHKEGFNLIYI